MSDVIRNQWFIEQARDFSGLQFGTIMPTDVDGLLDFGDRAFCFVEVKYGDKAMPRGQRVALERLADIIEETSRESLVLVAKHRTPSGEPIHVASCPVTEIRHKGQWRTPRSFVIVRDAIDQWLMRLGIARSALSATKSEVALPGIDYGNDKLPFGAPYDDESTYFGP